MDYYHRNQNYVFYHRTIYLWFRVRNHVVQYVNYH
nr:MAG TPA: hypothetical protein [Crassvirales sp.]